MRKYAFIYVSDLPYCTIVITLFASAYYQCAANYIVASLWYSKQVQHLLFYSHGRAAT